MLLAPGTRLGAYEVIAPIGTGGMGEVYRARDTRLNRDVAIKVLPELFAGDADRLARFKREAQVLASLNHPHIAAIYGLEESAGNSALVLELVEGPTLADRIARGPIPLDEALPIAKQIAEALEAAHEHSIIHRDLKPANIKLTDSGVVKVLDFGLAKVAENNSVHTDLSASPTITSPAMTMGGVILGTAAYMSPEQAKGKPLDKRADVWAFGCVIYEMLTGERAFSGTDVTEVLASVVRSQPQWDRLPPSTPPAVRRLLSRALTKDVRQRLADVTDARLDLVDALMPDARIDSESVRRRPVLWAIVACVAVASAFALGAFTYWRTQTTQSLPVRFVILPAEAESWPPPQASTIMSVSPDGSQVVYTARSATGLSSLWIRSLESLAPRALSGTEGATSPFWSPDGRSVGFFAEGKLKRIDAAGGASITLCDAPQASRGATWGADGVILIGRQPGTLLRTSEAGGQPVEATQLADGESYHARPHFLPDGRRFIFRATSLGGRIHTVYYVGTIGSSERTRLMSLDTGSLAYSADHLLFVQNTTLMAQPFDLRTLALRGVPVPLAEGIQMSTGGAPNYGIFSASHGGVLTYLTGVGRGGSQLVWLDRSGRHIDALTDFGDYGDVELSPDGTKVAVSRVSNSGFRDLWLIDTARKVPTLFTSDPAPDTAPVWSPDSTRVVYASSRGGNFDLYQRSLGGTAKDDVVVQSMASEVPASWSRDGRFILFVGGGGSAAMGNDLKVIELPGKKSVAFPQSNFNETQGQFSPDGKWIAYVSNESGRNEIYISSFPGAEVKERISPSGGIQPRWRGDGKELFYYIDGDFVSAAIAADAASIKVTSVKPLFQASVQSMQRSFYSVDARGQRFLVNTMPEQIWKNPMVVVVNWPSSIQK